jgi:hypothetical protein
MAEAEGTPAPEEQPEEEPDSCAVPGNRREEYLDEQEEESFPASDPHSDWSGPA